MAVAYGGIDVESEGAQTGVVAVSRVLATEWGAAERFSKVSGYLFALSLAIDAAAIKIEVMTELTADHMYFGVFDMEALVSGNFNPALNFDKCVKMIVFALKGEMAMTATVKTVSADAVDFVIRAPVACFEVTYKLRLTRAEMDKTHVLSAKLKESQTDCESAKLQLTAARRKIDELKEAIRFRDARIQELTCPGDAEMVMEQCGVSRCVAVDALRRNDGDIVNAIMQLTHFGTDTMGPLH